MRRWRKLNVDKTFQESLGGFKRVNQYVRNKISRLGAEDKCFATLYRYMFSERKNIFAEMSDGFRIKQVSYGECADGISRIAAALSERTADIRQDAIVGLYMDNSVEWIQIFWSILMCGYRPLLLNLRMDDSILEGIIQQYDVAAVISDGAQFCVKTILARELTQAQSSAPTPNVWADEVIFMSSGTTDNVKLCAYKGQNFYYQICDSVKIIEQCPQIKKYYEGSIKLLAFLPFYHVFGFIAVYLWFAFFARTFVFLKDNSPQTLLDTIRRHKVTHIFSVPLMWETIYKEARKAIRARGKRTEAKFIRALKLAPSLGRGFAKFAFKEVRENIFGESVRFMISGGSAISVEVLSFFNGIGYHLVNGYGMTEIGITSVEISKNRKCIVGGSVGRPFGYTEYDLASSGELLARGKATAGRILLNGQERVMNDDEWFATGDLAQRKNGRYYILGRKDDLIVGANGENINPELVEKDFGVDGCTEVCLIADKSGAPVFIASVSRRLPADALRKISADIASSLANKKIIVNKIVLTTDRLLGENDIKINRRKIAARYQREELHTVDFSNLDNYVEQTLSQLEEDVRNCFAETLGRQAQEISVDGNFFTDYGGSSLDYFVLLDKLKKIGVELSDMKQSSLATVRDICNNVYFTEDNK